MKRTNRKRVVFLDEFNYRGELIDILQGKQGTYVEILNKMIEQLDACIFIHKRVLVHRFDLHPTYYTPTNILMSKFIDRLKKWIKRNYRIKKIGYIWVREQERSKQQHYHLAIFLDGSKIQHPKKLNSQIKEMWTALGHMPVVQNPFYFIDKNDTEKRLEVIKRISYLAKVRGKGCRDEQAKDYQTSRIRVSY